MLKVIMIVILLMAMTPPWPLVVLALGAIVVDVLIW